MLIKIRYAGRILLSAYTDKPADVIEKAREIFESDARDSFDAILSEDGTLLLKHTIDGFMPITAGVRQAALDAGYWLCPGQIQGEVIAFDWTTDPANPPHDGAVHACPVCGKESICKQGWGEGGRG